MKQVEEEWEKGCQDLQNMTRKIEEKANVLDKKTEIEVKGKRTVRTVRRMIQWPEEM